MNFSTVIKGLADNKDVFKELFSGVPREQYLWKPSPEKWCLLEVVCHLYDEEREDFRARVKHTLETPQAPLAPIDPQGWVQSRQYIEQDYEDKLNAFLAERAQSISWLHTLANPQWDNACQHPKLGTLTAKMFLANWLAHDYLHIRQITKLKYDYLQHTSGEDLSYAGGW